MIDETAAPSGYLILRLPGLVAGRDLADAMLGKLSDSYRRADVIVDATRTSSASPSFSAQIIQHVLVEGEAASLTLAGAPDRMVSVCREVAASAGVSDRLAVLAGMPRRTPHPARA